MGMAIGPPLPSVPELYDPEADPAINVEFKGFSQMVLLEMRALTMSFLIQGKHSTRHFSVQITALMLSGQLPPVATDSMSSEFEPQP